MLRHAAAGAAARVAIGSALVVTAAAATAPTAPAAPVAPPRAAAAATACATAATPADVRSQLRAVLFLGFSDETPARLELLAKNGVGGFYISGNRSTPAALAALKEQLAAIQRGAPKRLPVLPFVAVDEEGGRVQRLKILGALPSARTMGTMDRTAIRTLAREHAAKMRNLSVPAGVINMDFAPVLDLDARASGVIADRSFSADPTKAMIAAGAFSAGLYESGLIPVFKHFPGHGSAAGDSHKLLPVAPPLKTLQQRDLLPYQLVLDQPQPQVVMVGHLIVDGLSTDDKTPTSLSPATYALLRNDPRFRGLLMTDDLGMKALAAVPSVADRVAAALIAGADLALVTTTAGIEAVLDRLEQRYATDANLRAAVTRANAQIRSFACSWLPPIGS